MALTYLALPILVTTRIIIAKADTNLTNGNNRDNPVMNSRTINDLNNESFLDQKDVLLDMLESKLKDIIEKKKKKSERSGPESGKYEKLLKSANLKLKANGISAVGEADLQLRFGTAVNSSLNLDASGISNIGRAQMDLEAGDAGFHIPGLNYLFDGLKTHFIKDGEINDKTKITNYLTATDQIDTRRYAETSDITVQTTSSVTRTVSTVNVREELVSGNSTLQNTIIL